MQLSTDDLKAFGKGVQERLEETLEQALKRCYGDASKSLYSQARAAVSDIKRNSPLTSVFPIIGGHKGTGQFDLRVTDVSHKDVRQVTTQWYSEGLSPATINKRLNCLSKMGVSVEGLRVKNPKKLKWYLKEIDKINVLLALRGRRDGTVYKVVADFIEWTTLTGLRIEESLRLTWDDLERDQHGIPIAVSVPGTKTASSQATLPLGFKAASVLILGEYNVSKTGKLFNIKYEVLQEIWDEIRLEYGWKDDPTATLKALRRSAARYLHVDCGMPLHMVQQYLRHESMDTTLEYLRLTGGYGTEEMRRYLK